jgi:hypothetical protein
VSRPMMMIAGAAALAMASQQFAGAQTELRPATPHEVQMDRARRRAAEPKPSSRKTAADLERIRLAEAKRARKAARLRLAHEHGGIG